MLPPIPQGLVPVTAQQDPVKQRPDVPPVTPAQNNSEAGDVAMQNNSEEVRERLRDEQRRRQKQQAEQQRSENETEDDADSENKKPKGMSRRGLWIDIKV